MKQYILYLQKLIVLFCAFFFNSQAWSQKTDPTPYCAPAAIKMTSGTCSNSGGNNGYRFSSIKLWNQRQGGGVIVRDSSCYGSSNKDVYRFWDYDSTHGPMIAGSLYNLEITSPPRSGNDTIVIGFWIDFNGDSEFGASEMLMSNYWIGANSGAQLKTTIKLPFGLPELRTRMRFRIQKGMSFSSADSCTISSGLGETWDFSMNIVRDGQSPVVLLLGDLISYVTLDCDSSYVDRLVLVEDAIDDSPTIAVINGHVRRDRVGTYYPTYQGIDASGNKSYPITRTVRVVPTLADSGKYYTLDINNGKSVFIARELSPAITYTKWYVDQQYQRGYDNKDTFSIEFKDTLHHVVCLGMDYCHDTFFMGCGQGILGKPYGLSGKVFHDKNANCQWDSGESTLMYRKILLYDSSGVYRYSTWSSEKGDYYFNEYFGKFRIAIDTTELPIGLQCRNWIDSIVALTPDRPYINNIDFNIYCKDVDASIISIAPRGNVFPGRQHYLNIYSRNFEVSRILGCSSKIGGQLKVSINGKVKYKGVPGGAKQPSSVSGNVITYLVSNFDSAFYNYYGFYIILETDTNATSKDSVCIETEITVNGTNPNPNNKSHYCYRVYNSFDPNKKEVYPEIVPPSYNGWFTYMVQFQNTGTAAAENIKIRDTLDNLLDPSTLQLLETSHQATITLNGNALLCDFKNIMLPDSSTNEEASHGFVQYRIKPKAPLPEGKKVENTAFIYFDYNSPVVTNTAVSLVVKPSMSIANPSVGAEPVIYPNPGSGLFMVMIPTNRFTEGMSLNVFNLLGENIYSAKMSNTSSVLDLSAQANGIYFVRLESSTGTRYIWLVKQ